MAKSGPEKTETNRGGRRFRLPILQGVLPVDRSRVPAEIIAGITLASLAIPEVMGYTKIAGTPVITGLFTMLIPMALFAVFGSFRHLVVGTDSATAAIHAACPRRRRDFGRAGKRVRDRGCLHARGLSDQGHPAHLVVTSLDLPKPANIDQGALETLITRRGTC